MSEYINPMPDYEKLVQEAEAFLGKLDENLLKAYDWSYVWKNINLVCLRMLTLERKWLGYKKSTGINPKKVMKHDIDLLIHKLGPNLKFDIEENESATDWGKRNSKKLIDTFVLKMPYLNQTSFYQYVEELGNLIDGAIFKSKHSEIMKLVREYKNHPDMIVVGQFSTNEMVDYFKFLNGESIPSSRREIMKYIDCYQKFCGIFEKDMIFCYCLLKLKETGFRDSYEKSHPESRNAQDRINFVKSRINVFGAFYDADLRNASTHVDIEVEPNAQLVTIYHGTNKTPKSYVYNKIISFAKEISAIILTFRLFPVILEKNDWITLENLLK